MMASGLSGQTNANAFVAFAFSHPNPTNSPPYKMQKGPHFEKHRKVLNFLLKKDINQSFKKMAVTKASFLVGLLVFLCLSLSSANRVLKDNDAENESISNRVSSGQDNQLHNFSHAELNSKVPKGSIPKFSSVGTTNGDCCNYDNNCGGGYVCPPNYGCGGNSGCQSCYTCSQCPWQGCQGGCQCQSGCQGCQSGCQGGCQGGCQVRIDNNSKVQESIQTAEPDPPLTIVPSGQPANHNIKSSGGANQDMKSNGGLV